MNLKDLIAKAKAASAIPEKHIWTKWMPVSDEAFDYFSYAHPARILALCEALERAREALEWIGDSHASPTKYYYNVKARQALAEIEKLLGGGE